MYIKTKIADNMEVYFDTRSLMVDAGNLLVEAYLLNNDRYIGRLKLRDCKLPKSMVPVRCTNDDTILEGLRDTCYIDFSTIEYHSGKIFADIFKYKDDKRPMAKMNIDVFEEVEEKEMKKDDIDIIKGLRFKATCQMCPEQYDVFDGDNNLVGYVRLRYGRLTCNYPDSSGECIYEYLFDCDTMKGSFASKNERYLHLAAIADAINKEMDNQIKDEEGEESKYNLFDAAEANRRTEEVWNCRLIEEVNSIKPLIEAAIMEGKYSISLDSLSDDAEQILCQKFGYTVEEDDDKIYISWCNKNK